MCVCSKRVSFVLEISLPPSVPPSKALPRVHSAIGLGRHKALSHVGFNMTLRSCELKQ